MRVAVYTALFGTVKDRLRSPLYEWREELDVDLFCFTDHDHGLPAPWKTRPADWTHPTSTRRTARYHKVMVHKLLPDYDCWIWVDACLQLRTPASFILESVRGPRELATFKHPQRDCVYAEFMACSKFRKDSVEVMQKQISSYKFNGFPPAYGLAETACLVRRNFPDVVEFSECWWDQIASGSLRDQLSFPYVSWKFGTPWGELLGCRDNSPYFVFHKHVNHGDGR